MNFGLVGYPSLSRKLNQIDDINVGLGLSLHYHIHASKHSVDCFKHVFNSLHVFMSR